MSAGAPKSPAPAWRLLLALAALHALLHLATNGRWGPFRDELYYLACADHLDWGYVDHPPLSIALLAAWRALVGDGIWAIRMLPAAAGAALVFLTGLAARELGGRRAAQGLAAGAALIAPAILATTAFYSMNAFEPLVWLGAALMLMRILRAGPERAGSGPWLWLGALLGLGLLNKISVLLLGAGIAVGLLATPARRHFARPGPWLAAGIALAIFTPHLIWQARLGWPTLEFMANARAEKMVAMAPPTFFAEVALETHPFNLLFWVPGLLWLFAARAARPLRALAWIWPVAALVLLVRHGKPYYLAPAQPLLLAAGAVAVAGWLERRWRPGIPVLAVLLVLGGLFTLPLCVTLLSPAATARYLAATGLHTTPSEFSHQNQTLPQHLADHLAWREQAEAEAEAHATLPAAEQADCILITPNYGQAGAADYYRGRGLALPPVVCRHNSYWYWWPEERSGETAIAIGFGEESLRAIYSEVTLFRQLDVPYAIDYEGQARIYLCKHRKLPLATARAQFRYFG